MKKSTIKAVFLIAITTLTIISCSKKDDPTPSNGGNPTGAAGSFTWTENGGSVITADSAFWTTSNGGTGIRAFKGGFTNFFEINWLIENNTNVGTKILKPGDVTFIKGSDGYSNSTSQNLSITSFSNDKLTGNFTVAVTGGSITTLVANFNAIPKK